MTAQQSVVQAKTEPEAPGSLVDWIVEEAKAREVWFPKSVAGADEKKPDAEQKKAEGEGHAEAEVVETEDFIITKAAACPAPKDEAKPAPEKKATKKKTSEEGQLAEVEGEGGHL